MSGAIKRIATASRVVTKSLVKHCRPDGDDIADTMPHVGKFTPSDFTPECVDLIVNAGMMAGAMSQGDTVGAITQGVGDLVFDGAIQALKKPLQGVTFGSDSLIKAVTSDKSALKLADSISELRNAKTTAKLAKKQLKTAVKYTAKMAKKFGVKATSAVTAKIAENVAKEALEKASAAVLKKAASKVAAKAAMTGASIATRFATTAAMLAPAGPAGLAIEIVSAVFQITGVLLDIFWDPFQTYFNKDLSDQKETIEASLREQTLLQGYEWPLEIKPQIMPVYQDQVTKFQEYVQGYYNDRGIITPETAAIEEEMWRLISTIKRDQNVLRNLNTISNISSTQQSIALLAAVAIIRRNNAKLSQKAYSIHFNIPGDQTSGVKYRPDKNRDKKSFVKQYWQVAVCICLCLCLISSSFVPLL